MRVVVVCIWIHVLVCLAQTEDGIDQLASKELNAATSLEALSSNAVRAYKDLQNLNHAEYTASNLDLEDISQKYADAAASASKLSAKDRRLRLAIMHEQFSQHSNQAALVNAEIKVGGDLATAKDASEFSFTQKQKDQLQNHGVSGEKITTTEQAVRKRMHTFSLTAEEKGKLATKGMNAEEIARVEKGVQGHIDKAKAVHAAYGVDTPKEEKGKAANAAADNSSSDVDSTDVRMLADGSPQALGVEVISENKEQPQASHEQAGAHTEKIQKILGEDVDKLASFLEAESKVKCELAKTKKTIVSLAPAVQVAANKVKEQRAAEKALPLVLSLVPPACSSVSNIAGGTYPETKLFTFEPARHFAKA
jgi:hypothetical protein